MNGQVNSPTDAGTQTPQAAQWHTGEGTPSPTPETAETVAQPNPEAPQEAQVTEETPQVQEPNPDANTPVGAAWGRNGKIPEPIRREPAPVQKREGPTIYELEAQTRALTVAKSDKARIDKEVLKQLKREVDAYRRVYPDFDWKANAEEFEAKQGPKSVLSPRQQAEADMAAAAMQAKAYTVAKVREAAEASE